MVVVGVGKIGSVGTMKAGGVVFVALVGIGVVSLIAGLMVAGLWHRMGSSPQ